MLDKRRGVVNTTCMTTPETQQITLRAYCAGGRIVLGSDDFATQEDAAAFVALLPKSCKARAGTISGSGYLAGLVQFHANLTADGVNGGRNETGIKRYRMLLSALDKLGVTVEWHMPFTNSLTLTETEELIA